MDFSEFRDEAERINRFTADEIPPEDLQDPVQSPSSSPPRSKGYDPYTLALRIVSILFILCLLFVATLYYGIINP